MLELNNYYIQELENLTDLFTNIFVIIDDIYNEIIPIGIRNRRNIKDSKLSDSEIITISIVGELLTIDSEKSFFSLLKREYKELFPRLGDRTRFNRTKRNLHLVISKIRGYISEFMQLYSNNIRVIDSMPIPVCEFGRAHFSKCFKGEASYGRCPSKKEVYFGYKVHAMITLEGYITNFEITPASTDDRDGLRDMLENETNMVIIGDKGYISEKLSDEMKCKGICVMALKRSNSKNNWTKPIRQLIFKLRRRVETVFSQLSLQLNSERVLAKSFQGLCTRLVNKMLAYNLCLAINSMFCENCDIGKIKKLIF